MKIAIVSDRVYPFFKGGAEKRYWDIAQNLKEKGHEIHFYTGQWPGMEKNMIVEGIHLHSVYKVKNFYVNGRKSIKESIIYSIKLFPVLMRADFDVIDADQFPLLHIFTSKLVAILKRKPLIVTWHEAWGRHWIEYIGLLGYFGMLVEFIVTKFPDRLIAVSEETAEGLLNHIKVGASKITVVNNGLDLKKIEVTQPSEIISDIIYVGRLLSHKNVEILVKTVRKIRDVKPNIKCLIVGNGPEKEKLIELTEELKLTDNIYFLGQVNTMEGIYSLMKSSKVLVSPSTREGFGITVIEANACGIPAIVTNGEKNASKRLIEHAKNGYISDLNIDSLMNIVLKTIHSSDEMNSHCIKYAQDFDWNVLTNKITSVYWKVA